MKPKAPGFKVAYSGKRARDCPVVHAALKNMREKHNKDIVPLERSLIDAKRDVYVMQRQIKLFKETRPVTDCFLPSFLDLVDKCAKASAALDRLTDETEVAKRAFKAECKRIEAELDINHNSHFKPTTLFQADYFRRECGNKVERILKRFKKPTSGQEAYGVGDRRNNVTNSCFFGKRAFDPDNKDGFYDLDKYKASVLWSALHRALMLPPNAPLVVRSVDEWFPQVLHKKVWRGDLQINALFTQAYLDRLETYFNDVGTSGSQTDFDSFSALEDLAVKSFVDAM